MNLQRFKNFILASFLLLSAGNSFSMENEQCTESHNSAEPAELLFNIRANINSASIIAGVWALRNLIYASTQKFYRHGCHYRSSLTAAWESFGTGVETALPLAFFAIGLWGVEKFWLREKYYKCLSKENPNSHLSKDNSVK